MKKILCGISVFLCLSCAVPGAASETTRGHLILNGGGSKPDAVMEKFVELAGGPDALIVVFPTASELLDTGDYYRELFAEYGCSNVKIAEVRSKEQAANDEIAEMVAGAAGIFFAGGDQRRITETLLRTPAGAAVAEAFSKGAVVGGTSAGTACQSRSHDHGKRRFHRSDRR